MRNDYSARIHRVLRYIHENPDGDLSLDKLADVAAMSRFHWHRVFQAMTGETCAQAVRRLRLYRAATWLLHYDWPIAQIAARVGYPNVSSFSRAFSDGFGVSPGAFRRSGGPLPPFKQARRGEFQMFDVEIKEIAPIRMAALTHIGPYDTVDVTSVRLADLVTAHGLWPHVRGAMDIYHDDPNVVPSAKLRAHVGYEVKPDAVLPEALEEVHIDGGSHAVLHFKGPYSSLKVAYDYLFGEWLAQSGAEPAEAPCFERYLNDPTQVPPEELLTDIYLPLAKVSATT